eukprot:CAMPEP_0198143300 /NCGR_PEP_ID=MMETSP1443-20131203/6273_1 /TAXON_ID=186043 /ORGANISM="Entomoneis sp., Strain CCMP2396" /LENGTH=149 /DNA_ID=CAMNT_0043806519 /DNA_START=97 /DNA_END=542 /DNA_ORIENTATION=-
MIFTPNLAKTIVWTTVRRAPTGPPTRIYADGSISWFVRRRSFSSNENDDKTRTTTTGSEWRKHQLDKLEQKFSGGNNNNNNRGQQWTTGTDIYAEPEIIQHDEELQPMWKNMESRVRGRKPRTKAENGGKTGRQNIKKTDEELWLIEGL